MRKASRRPILAACLLVPFALAAVAAAAPATLVADGVAPADPTVAATLPRFQQGRAARFITWLADGSLLIATRFGDTTQVHRVHAPLGMREQLSFAPRGVLAAAARPSGGDALVYQTPNADGLGTRLVLLQLDTHGERVLTHGDFQDRQPVWAPDGRELAFLSNRSGPDSADVYVLDTAQAGALPRLLAAGEGARWHIEGWSPDSRRLLLGREVPMSPAQAASAAAGLGGGADAGHFGSFEQLGQTPRPAPPPTALYLADVQTGTLTALIDPDTHAGGGRRGRGGYPAAANPLTAAAARFAADGSGIVLLTHALPAAGADASLSRQHLHLSSFDPATGRWRELSAPTAQDVQLFAESPDGHYLAYTLDEPGGSRLMLIDEHLRLEQTAGTVPPGLISSLGFDAAGRRLAFTLQSPREAPDVYVLEPATGQLSRWTHSEAGPIDTQSFVLPERLQYPTWDRIDGARRELPLFAYSPAGASTDPRPVVIWLCSGAGSQCRPSYSPFLQYLVLQLGCVVLAPQVRGSAGLGADLEQAGEGALTDDAVRDVGSLLVWIDLQPGLDRRHVALLGEGYGAYLALQSLAQYPDRLLGAVSAFPPPLAALPNALAIRRPVLLVQPLANPRVPGYEAAQLREGLRSQGVVVQYLAAATEAGPFRRKATRDAYQLAAASFLARLLRG